jgi:hypothetical protein
VPARLATEHYGPFTADSQFERHYQEVAAHWRGAAADSDMRWRLWVLTRAARSCGGVPGDFAEFGTYRGGTAFMILASGCVPADRRLLLYDTFRGIPDEGLLAEEAAAAFAGRFAATSVEHVEALLSRWASQVTIRAGDVMETVTRGDPGPLAFAHLDLNGAVATRHVLEHVFAVMRPGGMAVFDDYGWAGYEDQRAVIDEFFAARPEEVIALPTGQALVVASGP